MNLPLLLFTFTLILAVNGQSAEQQKLTELFRWKAIDFQFPNTTLRKQLLSTNRYIPPNNNPLGIEVWRNMLFVTVPRWFYGTGSTLNCIQLNSGYHSPKLIPYPDYEMNDIYTGDLNNKLISTTRIFVDTCDRLWVPDNGQEGIFLPNITSLASQKLLIFDLKTNRTLRNVMIGEEVKRDVSRFYEVVVDISNGDCNKAFAYIADALGYGLLVYSWETNTFRRITNAYFFFEPHSSLFGPIQIVDGLMGLALSGVNPDGYKTLYFHALASVLEYNVSTRVLQDPNLSLDFTNFKLLGSRDEDGKSSNQRFDEKTGVLFYTQVRKNGIGCWNSRKSNYQYSPSTLDMAVADRRLMIFPSTLTIGRNRILYVMADNLLSFATGTLDPQSYKYRVLYGSIDKVLKGTICKTN